MKGKATRSFRARQNKAGLTLLLESLIGLAIFATVILVLFGIISSVGMSNAQAREHSKALALARQALERELGKPYPAVNSTAPETVEVPFLSNGKSSKVTYSVAVDVTELTLDERKSVIARVTWQFGNIAREVELQSYVVSL